MSSASLSIFAGVAFVILALAGTAGAAEQPNVLLVVVDTLRADHLGCEGYKRPTSPRLDALAATGARFSKAHATSSWTSPSVASILTGLEAQSHGVELPSSHLNLNTPTLAESFLAAGYRTAAISANPAFVSPRQGFDRGFRAFFVIHSGPPASDRDVDVVPGVAASQQVKVATASQVSSVALDWLGGLDDGQPFLLYLHYFDPHMGYYPPPEYAERFGVPRDSPLLTSDQMKYLKTAPSAEELRTLESLYDGEIAFTDAEIGRVLEALPKSRPTLIVVAADHGEEFMDHGGMSHGRTLFEEMLRVPLIISGAGVRPTVVARPVSITDIAPTLLEMAALPPLARSDGRSLAATLRDGSEPPPRRLFADEVKAAKMQKMLHRHAVLDGEWKLLQGMESGFTLFDVGRDPGERKDVLSEDASRATPLKSALAERDERAQSEVAKQNAAPTASLSDEDKRRMRALGYEPD